jgi:hypothetical protein
MPVDESAALRSAVWESIGPDNVGGRMLAVEVDPTNPDRIWAGAASGGLWRSDVAGEGPAAWILVDTGFPTLSVSAIVLNETGTSNIILGTGEIGRYTRGQVGTPGARSSYGLGILRPPTVAARSRRPTHLTFDQQRAVQSIRSPPRARRPCGRRRPRAPTAAPTTARRGPSSSRSSW